LTSQNSHYRLPPRKRKFLSINNINQFNNSISIYDRAVSTIAGIEAFARGLEQGQGTLRKLVEDPSLYDRMAETAARLDAFSKRLVEGQGTLSRLIEGPSLFDQFSRGASGLANLTERIDRGEELAGALVRDEVLAKEIKDFAPVSGS
jgi:phospholipid/cholesterol/gamma-HCH transport system substrate-binding protein